MKTKFFFLILITMLFSACSQNSQQKTSGQSSVERSENPNLKLQVYYFHSTNRCITCNSIEENVKQVLERDFKDKIEQGIINFKVLNVDEKINKALAKEHQAAGAALHLVALNGGERTDNDLTNYAFSYSRNQPELFQQGIKDTINSLLK